MAFLSGGEPPEQATANLAAMQRLETPWPLTFSFGRALVNLALHAWGARPNRKPPGSARWPHHVARNAAAARGNWSGPSEH